MSLTYSQSVTHREMASSDSTSTCPESRAIRCHFASLAKAITDPLGLSMELFSKEIIEEVTMEKAKLPNQTDREKNSVLLSAVMRRVEARPSLFHCFIGSAQRKWRPHSQGTGREAGDYLQ